MKKMLLCLFALLLVSSVAFAGDIYIVKKKTVMVSPQCTLEILKNIENVTDREERSTIIKKSMDYCQQEGHMDTLEVNTTLVEATAPIGREKVPRTLLYLYCSATNHSGYVAMEDVDKMVREKSPEQKKPEQWNK